MALTDLLGIDLPLVQAPMAGVSSPAMAAAVSNAGALGSIGVGATDAAGARAMIAAVRERTQRPFNVNLFCHRPAAADPAREAAWIERLRPDFVAVGGEPPAELHEIYTSFLADEAMLAMLRETLPEVVSFHFGVPPAETLDALRDVGCVLMGCATNLDEAQALADAGLDAIIAQGWEAGGHRGMFDPDADDEQLGTLALVRRIAAALPVPVIAAGGIMNAADIAAARAAGAVAVQLGTAFVACEESLADEGYRAALASEAAHLTVMTRAISGRPARCLANRFTALAQSTSPEAVPAYPIAYDAGKALNAAAKKAGEYGYGAQWAGTGAPRARRKPAARLVAELAGALR